MIYVILCIIVDVILVWFMELWKKAWLDKETLKNIIQTTAGTREFFSKMSSIGIQKMFSVIVCFMFDDTEYCTLYFILYFFITSYFFGLTRCNIYFEFLNVARNIF